jgi:hypothetical protein
MSKVKQLLNNYARFMAIPWRSDAAPAQRVLFCVYAPADELRLHAIIDEFEIATRAAAHGWLLFDLTDTFADWLSSQRYAKNYFQQPHLLGSVLPKYLDYIVQQFEKFLKENNSGENTAVAIKGVGALFGLLKVKEVVDRLAPLVKGRVMMFFPGTYENNNYRLFDAYDGWNYLAIPITADMEY